MLVRTVHSDVLTTGEACFAAGPDFKPVGDPIQAAATPEKAIEWRMFTTVYRAGDAGDPAVGQDLYVLFRGEIAGKDIGFNGGAPSGQAVFDNCSVVRATQTGSAQ